MFSSHNKSTTVSFWHGFAFSLAAILTACGGGGGGGAKVTDDKVAKIEILQVIPSEAPPGAAVQITGGPFGANPKLIKVFFSPAMEAVIGNTSSDSITAIVPDGAKSGAIVVQVQDASAVYNEFTVTLDPQILSMSPKSGPPGTEVLLGGYNFSPFAPNNAVSFEGVPATVLSASSVELKVAVPKGGKSGFVYVTVGAKTTKSKQGFQVVTDPLFDEFSPQSGPVGTQVTIIGHNFGEQVADNQVTFAGIPATVLSATDKQLVVTVPAGAKTGSIVVTVGGKSVASASQFYLPSAILDFDPKFGKPGDTITLEGANFEPNAANNEVTINGVVSKVTNVISSSKLEFQIAAGTSSGPIALKVATPAGDFTAVSVDHLSVRTERFLFTLNGGDDTVSALAIDTATGKLTHQGFGFVGEMGVAVGGVTKFAIANDQFLFVVNKNAKKLDGFLIDPLTGALSSTGSSASLGNNASNLILHPQLAVAYVLNADSGAGSISQIAYDSNSGAFSALAPDIALGGGVQDMALDPGGKFLFVTKASPQETENLIVYAVDAITGELTKLTVPTPPGIYSLMAIHPSGSTLYIYDNLGPKILALSVNPATGALTTVGSSVSASSSVVTMTPHPSGDFLFVANGVAGNLTFYSVIADGSLQAGGDVSAKTVTNFPAGMTANHVAFDSSGTYVYLTLKEGDIENWMFDPIAKTMKWVSHIRTRAGSMQSGFFAGELPPVSDKKSYLYVANNGSDTVSQYMLDATGYFPLLSPGTVTTGMNPTAILPDAKTGYAFAAVGGSSNNVVVFDIANEGTLIPTGYSYTAGVNPVAFAIEPNGKYLYVTATDPAAPVAPDTTTNTLITVFRVNKSFNTEGPLTLWKTLSLATDGGPAGLSVSPSGDFLYSLEQRSTSTFGQLSTTMAIRTLRIRAAADADPLQGGLEIVTENATFSPNYGAVSALSAPTPSGHYIFLVNTPTTITSAGDITHLRTNSDGTLTGFDNDINKASDQFTVAIGKSPRSVVLDPSGNFVYVTNSGSNSVSIFAINEVQVKPTGNPQNPPSAAENPFFLTKLDVLNSALSSTLSTFGPPQGIGLDWTHGFAYITFPGNNVVQSYPIDATTGAFSGPAVDPNISLTQPKAVVVFEK